MAWLRTEWHDEMLVNFMVQNYPWSVADYNDM